MYFYAIKCVIEYLFVINFVHQYGTTYNRKSEKENETNNYVTKSLVAKLSNSLSTKMLFGKNKIFSLTEAISLALSAKA